MSADAPGPRILLMKDRGPVRKLLGRVLAEEGYEVHSATDAFEALLTLRAIGTSVDLLIVDAESTESSVEELGQKARELNPGCRMIVISASGRDEPWSPEDSPIRHLSIPFDLNQVSRAVAEALSNETPARTGRKEEIS